MHVGNQQFDNENDMILFLVEKKKLAARSERNSTY